MKFIKFYIIASIAIGIMQLLEGTAFVLEIINPTEVIASLIELSWVFVTIVAIFRFSKNNIPKLVPITFLLYNVLGWSYGIYLVSTVENVEEFNLPKWALFSGIVFGIYFATFNYKLYRKVFAQHA